METIFEEIIKGNLPKNGNGEEFIVAKGKKYFFIYNDGEPHKDQIFKFNFLESRDKISAQKCKTVFKLLGHKINEKTKKWGK
jgi:hypothetical protein